MTADPNADPPVAPVAVDERTHTERIDVRALALRALPIALVVVALGAVGGIVWGLLTPGVTGVVVREGRAGSLGADTVHRFDAVALFACVSGVVGVISGVVAWWDRRLRGPAAAVLAAVASMAGAGVGMWLGGLVAGVRHAGPGDTAVGDYFQTAPSLRLTSARLDMFGGLDLSWALVVVAPIGALVVCLVLLLCDREPDLGVPVSGGRTQGGELVGDA
ncbi:DUF2567 domain-containing protein [Williamsia sp. MIQD14]|uniref:DUF2567 domain-containing protein n=1 Tax=Williamsia sp. MIQD14 TaxID=3425703 RepID=UPI003DA18C86